MRSRFGDWSLLGSLTACVGLTSVLVAAAPRWEGERGAKLGGGPWKRCDARETERLILRARLVLERLDGRYDDSVGLKNALRAARRVPLVARAEAVHAIEESTSMLPVVSAHKVRPAAGKSDAEGRCFRNAVPVEGKPCKSASTRVFYTPFTLPVRSQG